MSNSEFFETAYRMTYYLVAAISLFMLVPRLIKAKINIFCILWVVFSAFLMSSSYVSIATYLVPPMAKLMPPLSPAEQVNAIKGAAHAVAINALPSLFFWHGGAPYRELPEELVKTMPEGYPSQEVIAAKREVWQKACFKCVYLDLIICLLGFIAIKMM